MEKLLHWFGGVYSDIKQKEPSISRSKFQLLVEKRFRDSSDILFPNIYHTSTIESTQSDTMIHYDNEYREMYIFDFDYLMYNKPTRELMKLRKVRLSHLDDLPYSYTLPTLLYTFAMAEDENLQNNLLELVLRCFSQRSKMLENLRSVNILSTEDEIQIFNYYSMIIIDLRVQIQESDTFITTTMNDKTMKKIGYFRDLVNNLALGLFKNSKVTSQMNILLDSSTEQQKVSPQRQNMMCNLKIHEIVISFLEKKAMMVEKIIESNLPEEYKRQAILLFQDCYIFLVFFTKHNHQNQLLLFSVLKQLVANMKYDLGQIDLVCAVSLGVTQIYEGNLEVCQTLKQDPWVLNKISRLINEEGRQVKFLKFFEILVEPEQESLLDNVYLVLNTLLPRFDTQTASWSNLEPMYLKVKSKNELEFDLDLEVISEVKDEVEFLVSKDPSDTTYREQPFFYHARILRLLQTILDATKQVEFFRLKIKEVFKLNYAFDIMMLEDDFTSRFNMGQKGQVNIKSKNKSIVKMATSYLKSHAVVFLKDVYFNQTILSNTPMKELEHSISQLVNLELMRFSSMSFQTQFLNYSDIYRKFDSDLDLFSGYMLHLVHSELFKQNMDEADMKENYQQIQQMGRCLPQTSPRTREEG